MLFSCEVETTDPEQTLEFEVLLDGELFASASVSESIEIRSIFNDASETESKHCFEFVLKNKKADQTQIDEQGNIVKDVLLKLHNVKFDTVNIDHLLVEHARYCHDFNGNGEPVEQQFSGTMGCNGSVRLNVTFPIYLWLLDHY